MARRVYRDGEETARGVATSVGLATGIERDYTQAKLYQTLDDLVSVEEVAAARLRIELESSASCFQARDYQLKSYPCLQQKRRSDKKLRLKNLSFVLH